MHNDWQSLSCNPQTQALQQLAICAGHQEAFSIWVSLRFCRPWTHPSLSCPFSSTSHVCEQHSPEVFFRMRQETELKISFASVTEEQRHLACSVTSKFTIHVAFKAQHLHTAYKCIHCDLIQFSPKPCLITHCVDQALRAVLNQTPGHKINFQQRSGFSFYPITSFIHHSSWDRTCGFCFPLRKMKEGYLKEHGYSANTCHLSTNNGEPLLGHLCMGVLATEFGLLK